MRAQLRNVLNSWSKRTPNQRADSIWTDGQSIYSYGTCLVAFLPDGGAVVNRTKYSVTTTIYQNQLAAYLKSFKTVDNIGRGASSRDLITLAKES